MAVTLKLLRLSAVLGFLTGLGAASAEPILSVCDVLRSPADFVDKIVTVRGIFRPGFETAVIEDAPCAGHAEARVIDGGAEEHPNQEALDALFNQINKARGDPRRTGPIRFACVMTGRIRFDNVRHAGVPTEIRLSDAQCVDISRREAPKT
jgi:hypothetical protein